MYVSNWNSFYQTSLLILVTQYCIISFKVKTNGKFIQNFQSLNIQNIIWQEFIARNSIGNIHLFAGLQVYDLLQSVCVKYSWKEIRIDSWGLKVNDVILTRPPLQFLSVISNKCRGPRTSLNNFQDVQDLKIRKDLNI